MTSDDHDLDLPGIHSGHQDSDSPPATSSSGRKKRKRSLCLDSGDEPELQVLTHRSGSTTTRRNNLRKRRKRLQKSTEERRKQCALHAVMKGIGVDVETARDLGGSRNGWQGRNDAKNGLSSKAYGLGELVGPDAERRGVRMKLVEWNGRDPIPIHDSDGRILCMLGGHPCNKSKTWDRVVRKATSIVESAAAQISFNEKQSNHRRGQYRAVSIGISYGGGQEIPGNLQNAEWTETIMRKVLASKSVRRIAGFGNSIFKTFSPKNHTACVENLKAILSKDEGLTVNFSNSVYAALTVNFGPRTVTIPHRDYRNWLRVWCAVTALGDFNPDEGGHLILWDLGLVIRFPAGSTILIPSALLLHSNAAIQHGERRYSITQFYAAGLFHWVYNGHRTDDAWFASATEDDLDRRLDDDGSRWQETLDSFLTLDELREWAETD